MERIINKEIKRIVIEGTTYNSTKRKHLNWYKHVEIEGNMFPAKKKTGI